MMKTYETREALMQGIADVVAEQLIEAIKTRGKASIGLPGGTTPGPFFENLSRKTLDWSKVSVVLGDERFVPDTSDRSNMRILKEVLLQNEAASATLIPMAKNEGTVEEALGELTKGVEAILPLDVLVVGMGEDLHTASLFPDSPQLADALKDDAPTLAIIHAENAGETRITMTAPILKAARHKHVLIQGQNKRDAVDRANAAKTELEAPVRVVIAGDNPATIHYAD